MSHVVHYLKNQLAKSLCSAEVSLANRTAAQENALHLVTSVISGTNSPESFAILDPDGSWQRMYGGYYQVRMEGFSDEFCETWPTQGIMRDGECFPLSMPARYISESGYSLLPTPMASDWKGWMCVGKEDALSAIFKAFANQKTIRTIYFLILCGRSATQAADFTEMMMGFPPQWSVLNATETP